MARARRRLRRFGRDTSGAAVVLGLILFVAMIVVAGIAVDMMRYESERQRVQGTADRAVIAATMLRGNPDGITAEQIVRSYFEAEGLGHLLGPGSITINETEQGRTVTITPRGRMSTTLMRWADVNHLDLNLRSAAVEGLGQIDLELVMVLDVSGSMGWRVDNGAGPTRMELLRDAARDFAVAMLEEADVGNVALTIVPYTTRVELPAGFLNHFEELLPHPVHGVGSGIRCHSWPDFSTVRNSLSTPMQREACAQTRLVRPYVTDLQETLDFIDTLEPLGQTHIDLGVRTGALFFDPDIRPVISQMITNGEVDAAFEGYPRDWNASNVYRAMILMTDGQNCCHNNQLPHQWNRFLNRQDQDDATAQSCAALRNEGVTIYAVSFEAPAFGVALMEECASAPNYHFNTTGDQLIAAFQSIATHIQISALRLTE